MSDDAELLRRYVAENSEEAFAELVRRHLGFVYHTALRYLNGDAHGAEDVAQAVFTDLARKAPALVPRPLLAGWLHTSTRYATLQHRRTERRRQAREQEAHLMQQLTQESDPPADWDRLRPVIDDALHALNPGDREAVLMRFFEGRGFAEVGARLDLSEDGARSRVDRALAKLQALLARRGVTSTAGALSLALGSQAAAAAPAGLALSVTGAALGGATAVSTGSALTLGALSLMKITSVLLAGSLAANAIFGAMYVHDGGTKPASHGTTTGSAMPLEAPAATGLNAIYDSDPAAFLVKLRAAGVPDRVQRALIEAAIDAEFRAREAALLPSRPAAGWWQWRDPHLPLKISMALLDLRREKARLRLQLLGPDPDAIVADSADNPIAPEKREMLKLITEDYRTMLASLRTSAPLLPADREEIRRLQEQRQHDLAELLTPEELTAYEARNWNGLSQVQRQIRLFDATEAEFEVIRSSKTQIMETSAATGLITAGDMQEEENRVRAALGTERFEAFDRSKRSEFQDLQLMLDRSGLSRDLALPVYGLWKNFEAESHRINDRTNDKMTSRPQALADLKQLAENTRNGILQQLGPDVGAAYLKRARWITLAERGEVITFTPGGWGGGMLGSPFIRPSPRLGGTR